MTDPMNRHLAPVSSAAWDEIDEEARDTLKVLLAGRKLFDFTGPLGWKESAVNLGRTQPLEGELEKGVQGRLREVRRLVELRVPFKLSREEVDSIDRGNPAPDLDPVIEAAQKMAHAEDRLIFDGLQGAGIVGAKSGAEHGALQIHADDYQSYPQTVGHALEVLRQAGVSGPYAIALGPQCFTGLTTTTTPSGYPVLEHVKRLVNGPVVSAPSIDGALVISQRGGDFELVVGRDLSIGYTAHDALSVELYLEESLTFLAHGPDAAVPLTYG